MCFVWPFGVRAFEGFLLGFGAMASLVSDYRDLVWAFQTWV